MKVLLQLLLIGCSLVLGLAWPAAAQPVSTMPNGYSHTQDVPPGYGGNPAYPPQMAPTRDRQGTPRRQQAQPPQPSAYRPPSKEASDQVAWLSYAMQDHGNRISRLEKDVAGMLGGASLSASRDTASSSLRSHTTYTVKAGDSLWGIASRHRVSPGEIIQINRMQNDTVILGQQLLIPVSGGSTTQAAYKPSYHPVMPGETSSSIAKKYKITREALMNANPRFDFSGGLIPGSRLIIPGKENRAPKAQDRPVASKAGGYTVQVGDSLKAIAIRHGTTTASLASLNGIKDPNKLMVGQRLKLPSGKTGPSNRSAPAPKAQTGDQTPASTSSDIIPLPGMGLSAGSSQGPGRTKPADQVQSPAKPTSGGLGGVLAYRIDGSDSLESIASQFSTTPERLREMNHLPAEGKLNAGDEIMVPIGSTTPGAN